MLGDNYMRAAYSYLYIRDFARAADAFQRAIESDPDNPSYYFHASVTALRNDCHDLALTWAQAAVRLDQDNPLYQEHLAVVESAAMTRKGHEALMDGAEEEARQWFRDAIDKDPLNEDARYGLSRLSQPNAERREDPNNPESPEEAV